ncbi:histidine phosphatase family protein [Silvimonas soli]|uniref:histidine phosphatase family protein n=1 Tax=Silvimonas soli TaxID=2980100 RepID=UPI0024B3AD23|nr:histidine phosphatase family protein [Silvimonas soli]
MSMLAQLYLVRHAQTAWSLTGQHTGSTELPLTPQGEDEARALMPVLRNIAFDYVLTSPRQRAQSTCQLAGLGATAQIEPDLAEWDYGDYEGLRSADIGARHPDWNIWRDGCLQGETPHQVANRADRLIARIYALRGNVALFSHGQFGAALVVRWIGLPIIAGQHFELHPASLAILGHSKNHPNLRVINLLNGGSGAP